MEVETSYAEKQKRFFKGESKDLLCKYHKNQNARLSNKKDPDYSIKEFVQKFAYDSLQRITCHTCVINNVISKKCSWNIDTARKVVHEDEEIPGTQLEENPKYVPPTRLRKLLKE